MINKIPSNTHCREMFYPKYVKKLKKFSKLMEKDENFCINCIVKFFMCFDYEDEEESAKNAFMDDHYYIIIYLVLCFKDFKDITEDQFIAVIYVLYALIIDDNYTCSNLNYPALNDMTNIIFGNVVLKLSLLFSSEIFKICNNDNFIKYWKPKCMKILNGKENHDKKLYLLKEINYTKNKSIFNGRIYN